MQKELGIQNKLNRPLSFYCEKVQLQCDSNHFHSQYIGICVFLVQVRRRHKGRQRLLVPPLARWVSHWAACHKMCWWAWVVQLNLSL